MTVGYSFDMVRRMLSSRPFGWGFVVPMAIARHAAVTTIASLREIDDALVPLDDDR